MGTKNTTADLGTVPVGKLYLKLAIPSLIGMCVMVLNNIIDRMWIGHIPDAGVLSLSAIGVCMPLLSFSVSLTMLVVNGMGTNVSISLGQGLPEKARKVMNGGLGFSIILSLLSLLAILLFCDKLLMMSGASSQTLPYAHKYLMVSGFGLVFTNWIFVISTALMAQGKAKKSMTVSIVSVALNIVFDPIFIFPLHLGVTGAALATNLGAVVAVLYGLRELNRAEGELRLVPREFLPDFKVIGPTLALGASTWLNMTLESVAMLIYNSILQKHGGDLAVSAMSLYSTVLLIVTYVCAGLSNGAQPIISYNYGNGNGLRFRTINKYFITSSFAFTTLIWVVFVFLRNKVWFMFSDDPELVEYTAAHTVVYLGLVLLNGAQLALLNVIKFIGKVKASLILGILKRLILLIPLLLILPRLFPDNPVMAALVVSPITEFLALVITYFTYRSIVSHINFSK